VNETLLSLRDFNLSRRTGEADQPILSHIDLDLQAGTWLAVVGANGAGKSSLLKYLAGEESPLRVPHAIMFQDPDEQIIAATVRRELSLGRPDVDTHALLNEFSLTGLGDLDPRLLSAGQKQRLVLAVAAAGRPRILFCDEPVALQDPAQSRWVLDWLRRWLAAGDRALVTATCDRREVLQADMILVLEAGRVALRGTPKDLGDHPRLMALLGPDPVPENPFAPPATPADPVLAVTEAGFDFAAGGGCGPVNLRLGPGQRVGLTGPNGCGKSTVLAACAGVRKPTSGAVSLLGRLLYQRRDLDLHHGAALLAPQFPEYLFTRSTVGQEMAVDPDFGEMSPADLLAAVGLDPALADRNPHSLSSGQKRRLALALVLLSRRPVLLLDEPSAGLDRAGRKRILDLIARVHPEAALLVASHDRDFLTAAGCQVVEMPAARESGP